MTTTVITFGATLCVPVIVVLTLEAETRADRWFRRAARRCRRR